MVDLRAMFSLFSPSKVGASTPGPGDDYWYQPAGGLATTGMRVTSETALKVSAVWRSVTILSGTVAKLPIGVTEQRADGGHYPATGHPLHRLLSGRPADRYNTFEWREH